ncbi:MAG: hypothetical protein ACXW5U_10605 [Thermoanaerobaculia bacterium]
MTAPRPPRLDERRTPEFTAELRQRAQAWIASWGLADGERDFGRALLDVAARFSAEVAERLDRAGDKMQRGLLDFLAVRGEAARPARVPVVFKLADTARDAVPATAPVQLQADAGGASVVFETESDVRLLPGRLEVVVGTDADADAFYFPPPGLSDLEPLAPAPAQWQLKSFAAAGAKTLQVDPEAGLVAGIVVEAAGRQYRIEQVQKEIISIEPPLTDALPAATVLRKVTAFAPYDDAARNRQEHALNLGQTELLDIETPATISVVGAQSLREGVTWQYWGKVDGNDETDWQLLKLADQQQAGAVVLSKPKGKVEPREIAGKKSRWIRAYNRNVPTGQSASQFDQLALRINARDCTDPDDFPDTPSPKAEGMANTTPLVLDNVFFPLGREPRQFDAFYLGCPEAFSKPGAEVRLSFGLGDPSFESLTPLQIAGIGVVFLAGVAGDGHLYLLSFDAATRTLTRDSRGPLRPPSPGKDGAIITAPPIALDPRPKYRTPMWSTGSETRIAVAAAGTVWIWHEAGSKSGWESLGEVGPVSDAAEQVEGLVHLTNGSSHLLYVLRDKTLFVRDLDTAGAVWKKVTTKDVSGNDVGLQTIVPVYVRDPFGVHLGTLTDGLAGVDANNDKLYEIALSTTLATCLAIDDVEPDVAPAAVRLGTALLLVGLGKNVPKLRAWISTTPNLPVDEIEIEAVGPIGHSIDVNVLDNQLTFVLSLQDVPHSTALAFWTPLFSPPNSPLVVTPVTPELGAAGGSPTLLTGHVLLPGTGSQVLIATLDTSSLLTKQIPMRTAVIASTAADQLQPNDMVAIPTATGPHLETVTTNATFTLGADTLYEFNVASIDDTVFVYRQPPPPPNPYTGTFMSLSSFTPDSNDPNASTSNLVLLLISQGSSKTLHEAQYGGGQVSVTPNLISSSTITYQLPEISNARLAPLMRLVTTPNDSGDWQASLLDRSYLTFPGAAPGRQRGKPFVVVSDRPELVALGEHWTIPPVETGPGAKFLVDARIREWTAQLGDTTTNPALSWEYANGTGWWKLDPVDDGTQNLKRGGDVRFIVPDDLRPMDWAGRTTYWIRARLVGGDYGKEIVTVKISPPDSTTHETKQTIERSTAGIRAPSVLSLRIAYRMCKSTRPAFVIAQDSGSFRDQSEANRTRGAIVEAFVPLAVALGRLSNAAAPAPETVEECPPPCQCPGEHAASPSRRQDAAEPAGGNVGAPALATGRALFIGLSATPAGAPVNVLLLVEKEALHDRFAPMRIEALVADRFVPVVASDDTRALGESGLLSLAFTVPPTPRELFGFENLTWLRLAPGGDGPASEWTPSLRGAYLNAVFAAAAETLTRELLGSSEGAPDLTVFLARPPVLHDTLELRVKEPLGDEEREELRDRVLNDKDLPGDWVLWRKVIDPADERPTARVYALDEATGAIRFGDGQHGAIPPIGVDSIVAFRYRRTELGTGAGGDVPGNSVTARTALNLVSPLETVEAVVAADQAAGGAPPESNERVLRFGTARLRHRQCALTAVDFEDLALESSPDIVQARCFTGRDSVRLVVVMRGKDPLPNAAELRELRRLLLAAAPASLGAPQAFRITAPRIRRLRVILKLRVATLDHAGEVSRAVQQRIEALFDTASWALGAEPKEEDVALAVIDTRRLEGLAGVQLREVLDDGTERSWTRAVKRDELVMLDPDPLRLELETVEVIS